MTPTAFRKNLVHSPSAPRLISGIKCCLKQKNNTKIQCYPSLPYVESRWKPRAQSRHINDKLMFTIRNLLNHIWIYLSIKKTRARQKKVLVLIKTYDMIYLIIYSIFSSEASKTSISSPKISICSSQIENLACWGSSPNLWYVKTISLPSFSSPS